MLQRSDKRDPHRGRTPFSVDTEPVFDGCHLVTVRGALDLAAVPVLQERLARLHEQSARTLILALDECTFIDSTGLQAVLRSTKEFDDGGIDVLLAGVHGPVRRVFEVTGVTNMVLVFPTVEQAKRAALG
jgi:anti-anti-sigma factor